MVDDLAAELMERCAEEISATVLDAGDAMSYRALSASAHVNADVSRRALQTFAVANSDSVDTLEVSVELGGSDKSSAGSSDPRARVIRVSSLSPTQSAEKAVGASRQIYGVYKKSERDDSAATSSAALACWLQERALRNDIFEKAAKHAPMSRAIKAFYESGITCPEATTRTGFGESQGEESVSAFDSVAAVARKPVSNNNSAAASNGSKSFFKATATTTTTTTSKVRGVSSSASSSTKTTPVKQPETKKIDAKSMSNVFTIDSDDEEDGSDADAPVFVKKASSSSGGAARSRSKRVISDDEDDDDIEDDVKVSKPAVAINKNKASKSSSNDSSSMSGKRKVVDASSSDEKHSGGANESDDAERPSSKRAKRSTEKEEEEEEEEEEEAEVPAVTTKRRVEVTKTRINEQGYMVTEKLFEEVELTAEEVEQERQQAAKRKKQQQTAAAAKAAAEAKAAAAEKKTGSKTGGGGAAAKQKNLFAFFQRK